MKNIIILAFLVIGMMANAQNEEDKKEEVTKMNSFASKTGVIMKFIDYSLPGMKTLYGSLQETKIRKIISADESKCFYQISLKDKYSTKTASIAYEDLKEVIKALKTLKNEAISDLALNPDYLENKFVTDDGFKLGYYVSKGKVQWYLVLEKYGKSTIYVKNVDDLEPAFNSAIQKIEELNSSL